LRRLSRIDSRSRASWRSTCGAGGAIALGRSTYWHLVSVGVSRRSRFARANCGSSYCNGRSRCRSTRSLTGVYAGRVLLDGLNNGVRVRASDAVQHAVVRLRRLADVPTSIGARRDRRSAPRGTNRSRRGRSAPVRCGRRATDRSCRRRRRGSWLNRREIHVGTVSSEGSSLDDFIVLSHEQPEHVIGSYRTPHTIFVEHLATLEVCRTENLGRHLRLDSKVTRTIQRTLDLIVTVTGIFDGLDDARFCSFRLVRRTGQECLDIRRGPQRLTAE
jgi:hypothetical protein